MQLDPWHRHQLRAIADCFEDGDAVRDVLVEAAKTHPEAARLVAEFLELVTPEIIAGLRQPSPKPARRLNNGSEADD